jgi:hypothetical protein
VKGQLLFVGQQSNQISNATAGTWTWLSKQLHMAWLASSAAQRSFQFQYLRMKSLQQQNHHERPQRYCQKRMASQGEGRSEGELED